MKILTNQTRYVCEYCKKEYKIERYVLPHEDKCKKNPKNYQPCLDGCKYIKERIVKVCHFYFDGYGEAEREVDQKILYCEKHKKGVYPYWISGIDEADIYDDIDNVPMPNKCDEFDNKVAEW